MTRYPVVTVLAIVVLNIIPIYSQVIAAEKVQAAPLSVRGRESVVANTSAAALETSGDESRAAKAYFDAHDYYEAAIRKNPDNAELYNKLGITELLSARLGDARKNFDRAVKLNPGYAEAYNNLGVVEYVQRRYGKATKEYEKAIRFSPDDASYFSNLGTAYFSRKKWDKATKAYARAVHLDPDVFSQVSHVGVAGQISSPGDQAHFSYLLAKLYAKDGLTDRSLECLRRAMEEGYKNVDEVYKDAEFASLRKDPRFTQLMASRPVAISE
ncbi:MAG TPA: tetratricopeptide repeat protein [Terriglobales bacterium]